MFNNNGHRQAIKPVIKQNTYFIGSTPHPTHVSPVGKTGFGPSTTEPSDMPSRLRRSCSAAAHHRSATC